MPSIAFLSLERRSVSNNFSSNDFVDVDDSSSEASDIFVGKQRREFNDASRHEWLLCDGRNAVVIVGRMQTRRSRAQQGDIDLPPRPKGTTMDAVNCIMVDHGCHVVDHVLGAGAWADRRERECGGREAIHFGILNL
mmetsp:Transcript_23021/g.49822  ORF Transcript_23021/g.49822 Transcript_23021/m.49822 type:complete len:137 (-) Transcript_23021:1553-1963(-)